ncbi:GNAT family protein [Desulfosporosinus sp. OT]|uniref:GNAT family N-acetyltransferase n=1 Tax=Desulfosporosinus sp. OT TaxID=913865 RepID=UPI000223A6C0|nr:GNAT family protein [Desulfosporosinus sp. OT]EGW41895.1 acetyltransferase family protein [Desulfosporosinus sp. OT]
MMHCQLRSGQVLNIRKAKDEDASIILDYINKVGTETDNLTFGEGEFGVSEDEEATIIKTITKSDNQLMLCAFINGKLVGQLVFRGGLRPRIRHAGEFGITVLKEHWGKGVGNELITCLITWARESHIIKKINLRVRSDHHNAINLYKKLGFVVEGTSSREFLISGQYLDSIHMGLEID